MVEREVAWGRCRRIEGEEVVDDGNRLLEGAGNPVEQRGVRFEGWELAELRSWREGDNAELGEVIPAADVLEEAEDRHSEADSAERP